MSPRVGPMVRDQLIRKLAPFLMRLGLDRQTAVGMLASLTADERYFLYRLRMRTIGSKKR